MFLFLKAAATAGLLAIIAGAEAGTPGPTLIAGALLIGAAVMKVLWAAARTVHRAGQLLDVVLDLTDWMPEVDERLDRLEESTVNAENSALATTRELDIPVRRTPRPRSA